MANKKTLFVFLSILIVILLGLLVFSNIEVKNKKIDNEISSEKVNSANVEIKYTKDELAGEISEYNSKIILSDENTNIEGDGVSIVGNKIKIQKAGNYYVSGEISDASIEVDVNKKEEVVIVLDNAKITSKTTSPINCIACEKLTVTLAENSINELKDSSSYKVFTDLEKQEPDGTLFSKTDLVVNGNGKLVIDSNYKDGIVSKDGLKIINSEIEIDSEDDAIRGKDYVAINNSKITITSKGAGIKSTNEDDETLGIISFDGGIININSEGDSIKSKNSVVVNSGNIDITSGDDAIHADTSIVINDGKIAIKKSYEGIESNYIEINGGDISVVSSDDGINVAGGKDSSSLGERTGKNSFSKVEDSSRKLVITGGNIKVNASGDGLDSNGAMYISGGNIIVEGPQSSGNGALDYDVECVVTGGNIIAYGAAGMWQNPSESSTQCTVAYSYNGKSGDEIMLKEENGNEIARVTTTKVYGGILFTNDKIQKGKSYTLYVNGEKVETLDVENINSSSVNLNSGRMKGNGMKNGEMNMDERVDFEMKRKELPEGDVNEPGFENRKMNEKRMYVDKQKAEI